MRRAASGARAAGLRHLPTGLRSKGGRWPGGKLESGKPTTVTVDLPRLVERGFLEGRSEAGRRRVQGVAVDEGC